MKPTLATRTTLAIFALVLTTIIFGAFRTFAATPLQGRIVPRPLTPGDITSYQLPPGTETSGGLSTVGAGQPVYLEVEVGLTVPATDIIGVAWSLTNQPVGSLAVLSPSPLGTNVPVFEPSDQLSYQVAGRTLLRPDVTGQYTVLATITTASEGTTNLALTVAAGTYMGLYTCELCHSGGLDAPNKVQPWSTTAHASFFTKAIDGLKSSHYNASCIKCHTVGYDTNTNAVNGGFDDVAAQLGWTFPTVLTNGNWASMQTNYPSLANLANIQCENCHGPGSEHVVYNGLLGNTNNISVSLGSGNCAQCHDYPPNDVKVAEWSVSAHAVTTTDPSGPGRESCVGCHTSPGFIGRIQGVATTNTTYAAINCQTCHDSHGETVPATNAPNPYLTRTLASVPLMDGTVVTNAGEGALCMQCHHSRQNAATYATSYHPYFGPHEGPQADMLEGVNGFTYGQAIPSSPHAAVVKDTCVTCHMQSVGQTSPAFLHAGGHTFKVMCDPGGDGKIFNMVGACQQCHGSDFTADSGWNVPMQDYDGDGVIDGVQDEVQNLLNRLSTLLPPDNTVNRRRRHVIISRT